MALEGRPLARVPRRELAMRIAVVPQETSLAFDYTALEMVLMGRYPHLGAFEIEGPDDLAAASRALEATGTAALGDRAFRTLSGGEKQRVVIASALAQLDSGPSTPLGAGGSLLLLDEPTASLSTHDLRFAASLCTRIVLLSSGRILAHGRPADVLTPELVGRVFDVPAELAAPILASARVS